jgi:hypothetical protein
VVTPAYYRPGSVETVTMAGPTGRATSAATADRSGRLHLSVPLGIGPLAGIPAPPLTVIGVPGVPSWGATATVGISGGHRTP